MSKWNGVGVGFDIGIGIISLLLLFQFRADIKKGHCAITATHVACPSLHDTFVSNISASNHIVRNHP